MFKLDLEKADEPEIKSPTSTGSPKKQESSRKTSTSASPTTLKPLMDREAWRVAVHGVTKSQRWLSGWTELMSCLCILKISPLLVVSFANIFSHSVSCLFILFMDSFAVQKLLIRAPLFIFISISITLGDPQKILLQSMSNSVVPIFSSRVL